MNSKTFMIFSTMAVAAVVLLFASGPIVGNEQALAQYFHGYYHGYHGYHGYPFHHRYFYHGHHFPYFHHGHYYRHYFHHRYY